MVECAGSLRAAGTRCNAVFSRPHATATNCVNAPVHFGGAIGDTHECSPVERYTGAMAADATVESAAGGNLVGKRLGAFLANASARSPTDCDPSRTLGWQVTFRVSKYTSTCADEGKPGLAGFVRMTCGWVSLRNRSWQSE